MPLVDFGTVNADVYESGSIDRARLIRKADTCNTASLSRISSFAPFPRSPMPSRHRRTHGCNCSSIASLTKAMRASASFWLAPNFPGYSVKFGITQDRTRCFTSDGGCASTRQKPSMRIRRSRQHCGRHAHRKPSWIRSKRTRPGFLATPQSWMVTEIKVVEQVSDTSARGWLAGLFNMTVQQSVEGEHELLAQTVPASALDELDRRLPRPGDAVVPPSHRRTRGREYANRPPPPVPRRAVNKSRSERKFDATLDCNPDSCAAWYGQQRTCSDRQL
ncbi:hypothetical protein QFZ97_001189 [Paraburkholderia youngii]